MTPITPILLTAAVFAGGSAARTQESYRIVINASNPIASLTAGQLARLFLTKAAWDNGQPVSPVDLASTSPVRESFSRDVLDLSTSDVIAHWLRRSGSGVGDPPPSVASDREVLAYVRLKPGAIGYVSAAADVRGVKVVSISKTGDRTPIAVLLDEAASGEASERQVQTVLAHYVTGLEGRNIEALKRAWPTMSADHERAMRKEFQYARSVRVELVAPRIDISGEKARVTVRRRYQLVTTDGNNLQADTTVTIMLRNIAGGWVIEDIRHQAAP